MALNNNIFYATNPAKISDALWQLMSESHVNIADMLIFLPSRRAVRTVEKMIAEKSGGVAILPRLVALGEGVDDCDIDEPIDDNIMPETERLAILTRLLLADSGVGCVANALPVAHDLMRIQDYLENEGVDISSINWSGLVDEKYASHFQNKAKILNILSEFLPAYMGDRITKTMARNRDIRNWIDVLDKYSLVIVCASTASVPATADLMRAVAKKQHGRIILSGKIDGRVQDFELDTNPYNSEYKFLTSLGLGPEDVCPIDVGGSVIDFMNYAFGNDCEFRDVDTDLSNCNLVVASRESVEAKVVADIVKHAAQENKSVLVITPDAAGNQRIAQEFDANGIVADFSGGMPGTMTRPGRAILNLFDLWMEKSGGEFDEIYSKQNNLFDTVAQIVDDMRDVFMPSFNPEDGEYTELWMAIKNISDAIVLADIKLNVSDARAFIADALSGVSVRGVINENADVCVLGTIESRMQTADVVILTGLNDGMFPAQGYENAWLPRDVADKIGLPSPDRKVSLQSLDFMNLSCASCVFWVRSSMSGNVQTAESRFISRVIARRGQINTDAQKAILQNIASQDVVPYCPLDMSVPTPPADWSDVYVTELEYLIHNPYAFYVKHILKLRVLDDYWVLPDGRKFGTLIHDVIENATDYSPQSLVAQMDARALKILGQGSLLFYFWHKRFMEIAPFISNELTKISGAYSEIEGCVQIAGRNVRARADMVWDGGVLDIKTGAAPNKKQLTEGNMPQLPLEALMLRSGGFRIPVSDVSYAPTMQFLQLKNNDMRLIEYDPIETSHMIDSAVSKVTDLFNMYSAGGAGYEYHDTSDRKYHQFDDFARKNKL